MGSSARQSSIRAFHMENDHKADPEEAQRVAEQPALLDQALGSRYRAGRTKDWPKFKNPEAPAMKMKTITTN